MQDMSAKSTRRVARQAGVPTITRAWVPFTGKTVFFATWDHLHGWLDRATGEVEWEPRGDELHVAGCHDYRGELLLELEPFEDDGHWPTLKD